MFLHGRGLELEKYYVGVPWVLMTSSATLVNHGGYLADWHVHLHCTCTGTDCITVLWALESIQLLGY